MVLSSEKEILLNQNFLRVGVVAKYVDNLKEQYSGYLEEKSLSGTVFYQLRISIRCSAALLGRM